MKQHLSEEEIAGWAMGERTPALQFHVSECAECRAQTETLSDALLQFRHAAHGWAQGREARFRLPAPAPWWRLPARWALVTAGLILLAAVPAYETYREHRAARERAGSEAQEAADAALLRQVDAGISRRVPQPLEPLVSLVSWSSGSGAGQ
ncbi:MAG: hypothetical protein ABUS51_06075 [Acidobacteriota bacterium]